jgi:hydroxymethylglutaryl-CoA lyase
VIDKVSVFTAASESFSLKNTNASIEETIRRFRPVVAAAKENGQAHARVHLVRRPLPLRGRHRPERVGEVCADALELGIDEIDLGDTIGAATPETITPVLLAAIEALDGAPTTRSASPR